ncbi:MAG TPA: hypothetical protein VFD32_00870 [Dehalococcoidia bacterium]|nr:hypothetical protein [Dehalococcoidia bacterium]
MAGAPKFSRVRRFAWPVFTVSWHGEAVGFVSQLPTGDWIAYRQTGPLAGSFASRTAAAEALTASLQPLPEGRPRPGTATL